MKLTILKFFIFFITFGLISCSNDENNLTENTKSNVKNQDAITHNYLTEPNSINSEWEEASNPENPLDYIGYEHNMFLQNFDENNYNMESLDEVYSIIEDHFNEEGQVDNLASREFLEPIINNVINYDFESYINQINVSSFQRSKLLELIQIIDDYDGNNIELITNQIKDFENQLESYSLEEKSVILIASSVSRYSMLYWDTKYPVTNGLFKGWKLRKWLTIAADAIGGAAGAAAGSSTVIGAVAGAVKGAGATSAAFDKAWDILSK
ncbi:hypothetical protein ACFSQ0_07240 [Mesonia sediminis]|uniref:Glycine zipper family protein n=1 Tax=Mesonia sediminis TaxID=1703946 RepID=A0ABW5SF40_9FLAO